MFDFLSMGAVHDTLVQWSIQGALGLSWWQVLAVTLVLTHITIASVTISTLR